MVILQANRKRMHGRLDLPDCQTGKLARHDGDSTIPQTGLLRDEQQGVRYRNQRLR